MTRRYSLIPLCLILFFLFSCKKDPNSILGDDLNKDRNINEYYADSIFQITAFTIPDDSLYIYNYTTFLLGTTYSEVFGTTTYNLITQLIYNSRYSYLYKEGEEMQHVDSVVLTIPYSKKYPLAENSDFFEGRSFTLTIYEVDEDIDTSAKNNGIYNIHSEVAYKPTPLYEDEVTLHPALSTDSTAPRNINFHLKDEKAFGERISRILEQALDNQNSDEFQTNFKGLYFVIKDAESPEQSIVADFNTDMASGTNLCVYFNGNLDTIRASSYYRFAINTHFTQIKKNRNNSIIKMWDSIAGQEKLYIESVGGSRIRLKFPNLRALLNDTTHIAINRAALIFKVANSSATGILAPSILHLYKYINSQSLESIIDYGYNGGGTYDAAKGEYRLYITRWMQDLMYNKDKEIPYLDLSAVPETRFMYPTQVEFYGTNSGKNKVRLEVLYSTIQK